MFNGSTLDEACWNTSARNSSAYLYAINEEKNIAESFRCRIIGMCFLSITKVRVCSTQRDRSRSLPFPAAFGAALQRTKTLQFSQEELIALEIVKDRGLQSRKPLLLAYFHSSLLLAGGSLSEYAAERLCDGCFDERTLECNFSTFCRAKERPRYTARKILPLCWRRL